MNLDELNQNLELQESNLKMLLESSINKQKALIKNDLKALEKELHAEENILISISNQSAGLPQIIKKVADDNGVSIVNPTLSEFVNAVSNKEDSGINKIDNLRSSIRSLVKKIDYANNQNNILIENARSFIRDFISNIIGISKKSLLDAKV